MTGVIDEDTCPQCGHPHAYTEFQTRTFEDTLFCTRCGYQAWTRTLIDRKRSAADPEGRTFFKRRKDGGLVQRFYERKGAGVCCVRAPNGVGHLLTFHEPLEPARSHEISAAIQFGKWGESELNPDGSYLTAWDPEIGQVRVLAGAFPSESPAA